MHADDTVNFIYDGRLVDSTGKPTAGPVALQINFYHQAQSGNPVLTVTQGLEAVTLQEGLFEVTLAIGASDYAAVFSSVSQPVWVEVTDLTNSPQNRFRGN